MYHVCSVLHVVTLLNVKPYNGVPICSMYITERTRDTLIHELCHAAVWLINGTNGGHGPYWKYW
jgi:hypothetical protein